MYQGYLAFDVKARLETPGKVVEAEERLYAGPKGPTEETVKKMFEKQTDVPEKELGSGFSYRVEQVQETPAKPYPAWTFLWHKALSVATAVSGFVVGISMGLAGPGQPSGNTIETSTLAQFVGVGVVWIVARMVLGWLLAVKEKKAACLYTAVSNLAWEFRYELCAEKLLATARSVVQGAGTPVRFPTLIRRAIPKTVDMTFRNCLDFQAWRSADMGKGWFLVHIAMQVNVMAFMIGFLSYALFMRLGLELTGGYHLAAVGSSALAFLAFLGSKLYGARVQECGTECLSVDE